MSRLIAAGVDPGPATGICLLYAPGLSANVYQCDAVSAPALLNWLLPSFGGTATGTVPCGIEGFVTPSRGLKGQYGDVTRSLVTTLNDIALAHGLYTTIRSASAVKPWATDLRLRKAGLYALTGHGMAHARDAARHALFTAVEAGKLPDPVSRDWPLRVMAKEEGE